MSKVIEVNGRKVDLARICNEKLARVFRERVHDGENFLFWHNDYKEEHTDHKKPKYGDRAHFEYGDHVDHSEDYGDYSEYDDFWYNDDHRDYNDTHGFDID